MGLVGLLAALWRFTLRPIWRRVKRIDAAIGFNGGSSLFEQIEHLKDIMHVNASLADAIDLPNVFIAPDGSVKMVNVAFTEATGLTIEAMRWGGWRQMFGPSDRADWDEAVKRHDMFSRRIALDGVSYYLVAKPVLNGEKFLGWRAVLRVQVPRRRVEDP